MELAAITFAASSLSRAEQAALTVGELAEAASTGERLGTKASLREACGVSKGTFNEALRILQARGLVSVRPGPGGGIFAAPPNPVARLGHSMLSLDMDTPDVADAIRIREALDPLLIDDAIQNASPADLGRMHLALDAMAASVTANSPTDFVRANWQLHATIARCSTNVLLRTLYLSLLELVESHTLAVEPSPEASLPEYIAQRNDLHQRLVRAIETRDRHTARQLIEEHNSTQR